MPLSSITVVLILWARFVADAVLSPPIAALLVYGVALFLGLRFSYKWVKTPKGALFILLLSLPVLPALIRHDLVALTEITGNLVFFITIVSIAFSSSFQKFNVAKYATLFYALPIGIAAIFDAGTSYTVLLSQLNPFVRGIIAAPGSHLTLCASLMLAEAYFCRRWPDFAFSFFLICWAGSVTAILSIFGSFLYMYLVSKIRFNIAHSKIIIALISIASAATLFSFYYLVTVNQYLLADLGLSRNADTQYSPLSGRDTLWRYNFANFQRAPLVGVGASEVRISSSDQLVNSFGERVAAGSESYFDYYLARDGIFGIVYIMLWIGLLLYCSISRAQYTIFFVANAFVSSLGSGGFKNFYSLAFFLFICVLFQFHPSPRSSISLKGLR